jgi:hypothetical protein
VKEQLPEATVLASPTIQDVSTAATDSEATGLSAGALAGIIVGAIVAVCAFGAGAYFCTRSSQEVLDTEVARPTNQGPSVWVPPSGGQSGPATSQTTVTTTTTITGNPSPAPDVPAAQAVVIAEAGPAAPAALQDKFCPGCGAKDTGAKFCGGCGRKTD